MTMKNETCAAIGIVGGAIASLLGGCEYQDPQNPVSKKLPSAITS